MTTTDTPTLLANASAGQLIADAMCAERYAAADAQPVHRDSLLRLAELARAVVALELSPMDIRVTEVRYHDDADVRWNLVEHYMAEPRERTVATHDTLCAALASTRHTQGEGI